jgi:hypothetical protein
MRALLVLLLLAGCASPQADRHDQMHAVMADVMLPWKGATIEEVSARWGPPASSQKVGTLTWYTWRDSGQQATPAVAVTNAGITTIAPSQVIALNCSRQLAVDDKGLVVHGRWEGNACPTRADVPAVQSWRRR